MPLAFLIYGIARASRHTVEAGPSLFGVLGAFLVLVGLVALVWTQLTFGDRSAPGAVRWDVAIGPLIVFALGLLVLHRRAGPARRCRTTLASA